MITRKPRLVIDLTHLANPACGFGQIALNYARLFGAMARDYALYGLFPGQGADVQAPGFRRVKAPSDFLCRFFPFLLPKADVWHMPNQYCRLLRKSRTTRVVLTIHDLNFLLERSEAGARRRLRRLQKKVDRATAVVAISHYVESLVRKSLDLRGKDLRVIYDGVEELTAAPRTQPSFVRGERPFFFAIGELRAKKNFETLIEMMPDFPDHDLYICGKNRTHEADAMRRRIAELGLTNVFLPGIISNPGTTVRYSLLKPACISSNFAVKFELWTKLNYTGRFSHPSVLCVPKGNSHRHSMPTVRLME